MIEAIVERLDAKTELFMALEKVVGPEVALATNTSSLSVTAIGARLQHPGRFAGMHFFNPVPLMKVVEIIPGLRTGAACKHTKKKRQTAPPRNRLFHFFLL